MYTPLLDAKSAREEVPVLDQWISERSGNPVYRYGKQQFYGYLDPSAFEEDLGDDAVKSATYGVQNLKYVLANLHDWTAATTRISRSARICITSYCINISVT